MLDETGTSRGVTGLEPKKLSWEVWTFSGIKLLGNGSFYQSLLAVRKCLDRF